MTTSVDPLAPFELSPAPSGASSAARVVAFGGGTGMASLLAGMRTYTPNLTAVVTVTDNGGSSGRLRNDFDMAAPGDIRNCLIALADVDPLIAKVFQYRFNEAEFKDHCFGNLFITVLTRVIGNFEGSIRALNTLLKVKGRVIPATSSKVSLVAHHPDGTKSTGEVQITRSGKPIDRVELRPGPVQLSPEIREAIRTADLFLFGPGSLFTSVIPNLLTDGIMAAINENGAPRVYIANIMTQPGETDGFTLSDHILALRRHVGGSFPDCVLAHKGDLPQRVLEKYRTEGSHPVLLDLEGKKEFETVRVHVRNFFRVGETARHDSELLARAVYEELLVPLANRSAR
ncbi:MAG TPA: uridine diphosphate-N-acetylglucosamine-binding protein YvcK [Planctomycetota bacterium]|nr:uridine diphosphate-N-acetylglucosamine-binding protein YvcK [Planctomycetota bacterium]